MSFSNDVKAEVCATSTARHCNLSLLSSILISGCDFSLEPKNPFLNIKPDNEKIIELTENLIFSLFNIKIESNTDIIINDPAQIEKILYSTGIKNDVFINNLLLKKDCCKRQYIKGIFLLNGSCSEPKKNYHLEFVFHKEDFAKNFLSIINFFDLNAKTIKRKKKFIVYIKDSEKISDFLRIIGANMSLLEYENIRVLKDVTNNCNRRTNCETYNIIKSSAVHDVQKKDILYIKETKGLDFLQEDLRQVAILRLENEYISLREIAELSNPKLTKAAVNYKLKKISIIADNIRGGLL